MPSRRRPTGPGIPALAGISLRKGDHKLPRHGGDDVETSRSRSDLTQNQPDPVPDPDARAPSQAVASGRTRGRRHGDSGRFRRQRIRHSLEAQDADDGCPKYD